MYTLNLQEVRELTNLLDKKEPLTLLELTLLQKYAERLNSKELEDAPPLQ